MSWYSDLIPKEKIHLDSCLNSLASTEGSERNYKSFRERTKKTASKHLVRRFHGFALGIEHPLDELVVLDEAVGLRGGELHQRVKLVLVQLLTQVRQQVSVWIIIRWYLCKK